MTEEIPQFIGVVSNVHALKEDMIFILMANGLSGNKKISVVI